MFDDIIENIAHTQYRQNKDMTASSLTTSTDTSTQCRHVVGSDHPAPGPFADRSSIRLRRIDLDLAPALAALLDQHHVTRAAELCVFVSLR